MEPATSRSAVKRNTDWVIPALEQEEKSMSRLCRFRGPFLESPGNFTGPKSKIQIEI